MKAWRYLLALLALSALTEPARSAPLRILSTGASKTLMTAFCDAWQKQGNDPCAIETDTAGGVVRRIEASAGFDVAIATQGAIDGLISKSMLSMPRTDLAATKIGVAVRAGARKPDISTVEAFRQAMLEAKTIAYIDPAAGGTSGIYIAGVLDRLGLTEALKSKLRLKAGGYVGELVRDGEAEIAIHQISELLPVKGIEIVGGLPAEIQSRTVYSGALPPLASEAALRFIAFCAGPQAETVRAIAGMEAP